MSSEINNIDGTQVRESYYPRIEDLHQHSIPDRQQLLKRRVFDFEESAPKTLNRIMSADLTNTEQVGHENLLNTIRSIITKGLDKRVKSYKVDTLLSLTNKHILPICKKMLQLITVRDKNNNNKPYVRFKGFVDILHYNNGSDTDSECIDLVSSFATGTTGLILLCTGLMAGTGLFNQTDKIKNDIADKESKAILRVLVVYREGIVILSNLAVECDNILEGFKNLNSSDKSVLNAKNILLGNKSQIDQMLLGLNTDYALIISKLLEYANDNEATLLLSILEQSYKALPISEDYLRAVNIIYQNLNFYDPNRMIYIPTLFATYSSDPKLIKCIFRHSPSTMMDLGINLMQFAGKVGEVAQSYFLNKGAQSPSAAVLVSLHPEISYNNINRPNLLLAISVLSLFFAYAIELFIAFRKYNKELETCRINSKKNVYALVKAAQVAIVANSTVPSIINDLENSYKQFMDAYERCSGDLLSAMSAEFIEALQKYHESARKYIKTKINIANNHLAVEQTYMSIIDPEYQYMKPKIGLPIGIVGANSSEEDK